MKQSNHTITMSLAVSLGFGLLAHACASGEGPASEELGLASQPIVGSCTAQSFGAPCDPDGVGGLGECEGICNLDAGGNPACFSLASLGLLVSDFDDRLCGSSHASDCSPTGKVCQNGQCVDPNSSSQTVPDGTPCQRLNGSQYQLLCTGKCLNGSCVPNLPNTPCAWGRDACEFVTCNPSNADVCLTVPLLQGTACDPGPGVCDGSGQCGSGGAAGSSGSGVGGAGGAGGSGVGGSNAGGSNAGGSNAGGSNAGGSSAGGSNAGGSGVGGSNAGGSNAGGSGVGGSNAGGSNAGGSGVGGSSAGGSNAGGSGVGGSNAGGSSTGGSGVGGSATGGSGQGGSGQGGSGVGGSATGGASMGGAGLGGGSGDPPAGAGGGGPGATVGAGGEAGQPSTGAGSVQGGGLLAEGGCDCRTAPAPAPRLAWLGLLGLTLIGATRRNTSRRAAQKR